MPNLYIRIFKDTIKNFYKKALTLSEQKQQNSKRFAPEFADKENAEIDKQLEQAYLNAKQNIKRNFENLREMLAVSNFPTIESLSADRMFFDKSVAIDLSATEVSAFIEVHKGNPTMLRIIKRWLEIYHKDMDEFTPVKISIVLPEEKVCIYKQFAVSALSVIDTIFNSPSKTNENIITAYADESFAKELFEKIGDGNGLSDFKSRKVPETAKHAFDHITLDLESNSNFQFNFKSAHINNA